MMSLHPTSGSTARIVIGRRTLTAMRHYPETRPAATPLERAQEELEVVHDQRVSLEVTLDVARIERDLCERDLQKALRDVARRATVLDGRPAGALHAQLFREGLQAALAPAGREQVVAAREVQTRLAAATHPQAPALREQVEGPLTLALVAFEAALGRFEVAEGQVEAAFQRELALRDAHLLEYGRAKLQVESAFAGDREQVRAILPKKPVRRAEPEAPEAPAG
jgi:hypothetical protein